MVRGISVAGASLSFALAVGRSFDALVSHEPTLPKSMSATGIRRVRIALDA